MVDNGRAQDDDVPYDDRGGDALDELDHRLEAVRARRAHVAQNHHQHKKYMISE